MTQAVASTSGWAFFSNWQWDPVLGSAILFCAVAYLWAAAAVGRRHPQFPWPARATACFLGGLVLSWLVLLGPIGAYDDTFFWAHMTQHVVLMMVVAPLLVLGSPILLVFRLTPHHVRRRRLVPLMRSRPAHALSSPVGTWLLFAAVIIGTHFTPFYNLALEHDWIHRYIEHPLYLGAGLLFYFPLLDRLAPRRLPPAGRVGALFLMMVPEAMTGFFIYSAGVVLYPHYLSVVRPFGPGPLPDQQLGGALMWAGSMIIDAGWVCLATRDWLRAEEQKGRRVDAQIAREAAAARHL